MGAARYISLSEADNKELRGVENNKGLSDKVRLRAKVLRLSNIGMSTQEIAAYTGRHLSSITRDFNRWEAKGLKGLVDGVGSGQPSPVTKVEQDFLIKKLSEDRSWTAGQLCEVLNEQFKLTVNRESMRVCLHSLGYSWQRHRYIPVKKPDAELLSKKEAELKLLKKDHRMEKLPSSILMK